MAETDDITMPVLVAITALPHSRFWRQSSGLFKTVDGKRFAKVSATGVADIIGCYKGRAVAIETKTSKGKLRESQKRFRESWEWAGGLFVIARCPQDALDALNAL